MISRRAKRSASPQENLRQFALNFSKGVDVSKAPTDTSTVLSAKNLTVNLDGSLSLRKPVELVDYERDWLGFRYLYDGKSKLCWNTDSFYIKSDKGTANESVYTLTTYKGTVIEKSINDVHAFTFDESPKIVNLNTATVIGNVFVNLSEFDTELETVLDPNLYDDMSKALPRYLRVQYDVGKGRWVINIITPEPNLVSQAEGDFALNPNLTLDNPYATRDSYDNSVPSVKGIVAYVKSKLVDGVPTPDLSATSTAFYTSKNEQLPSDYSKLPTDPTEFKEYSKTLHIFGSDSNSNSTQGHPLANDVKLVADLYSSSSLVNWSNETTVNMLGRFSYEISFETPSNEYASTVLDLTVQIELGALVKTRDGAYENLPVQMHTVKRFVHVPASGVYSDTFEKQHFVHLPKERYDIASAYAKFQITAHLKAFGPDMRPHTVSELTESSKEVKYVPTVSFAKEEIPLAYLKAFCNLPFSSDSTKFYAAWFQSDNGIDWSPINAYSSGILVRELDASWKAPSEDDVPASADYVTHVYYPLAAVSELDRIYSDYRDVLNRPDVLEIPYQRTYVDSTMYKFTIIVVEPVFEGDPEYSEDLDDTQYRVLAKVSEASYTPLISSKTNLAVTDLGNAVLGNKLYHKKAIYSYGYETFKNNILISNADSFITPLYNIIDVDAVNAATVTCVIPWRDYLVSATENAIYLHSKQESGYYTKTVNTSVGIPEADSNCCKAILNGIVFKSGNKIYQLIPNAYSGDDSTLNVNIISNPVEEFLEEYQMADAVPFAISTDSEYVLMLPEATTTKCLRYTYSSKMWTVSEYSALFESYWIKDLEHIYVFGKTDEGCPGVWLLDSESGSTYDENLKSNVPISFELDTGQKTDGISLQKQFVESKLMFATEDDAEAFPMQLTVAVDGDPHVTTVDVNTDAPFWKTGTSSVGVAGTGFRLTNENALGRASSGILRQLIVRYSGKGRSVRHILIGTPTSNFRLYETYVRYKTLNVKK